MEASGKWRFLARPAFLAFGSGFLPLFPGIPARKFASFLLDQLAGLGGRLVLVWIFELSFGLGFDLLKRLMNYF